MMTRALDAREDRIVPRFLGPERVLRELIVAEEGGDVHDARIVIAPTTPGLTTKEEDPDHARISISADPGLPSSDPA
jgi:hypothetical protein